jgi:1,4-dihydroxy-2-naphthoyl-CoA hydrolase
MSDIRASCHPADSVSVIAGLDAERRRLLEGMPVPIDASFAALYGLRITDLGEASVTAHVEVRDEVRQPMGLVDGGVYAAIAEDIASLATANAVYREMKLPVGQSNNTSFFRPIRSGHVHAHGRALHRGRTTWVWDVCFFDDSDHLCATSRVTLSLREWSDDRGA